MKTHDDDLIRFESQGAEPLPETAEKGFVEHAGARIWYAVYGAGQPLVLLHGGLGNSGNWGYQLAALVSAGYRVVLIDSRGHGRSTRDEQPYSYNLMSEDVLAVLDLLVIPKAGLVGWSDGACTALILASRFPERAVGVFFFACNMDPSGAKEIEELSPVIRRCLNRHVQDYKNLSATPGEFGEFSEAVGLMQRTQPNYSTADLVRIRVPVNIVQAEFDEFIKEEHAEYLAESIPGAKYVFLPGVSHFAPLQRPEQFNQAVLDFMKRLCHNT